MNPIPFDSKNYRIYKNDCQICKWLIQIKCHRALTKQERKPTPRSSRDLRAGFSLEGHAEGKLHGRKSFKMIDTKIRASSCYLVLCNRKPFSINFLKMMIRSYA